MLAKYIMLFWAILYPLTAPVTLNLHQTRTTHAKSTWILREKTLVVQGKKRDYVFCRKYSNKKMHSRRRYLPKAVHPCFSLNFLDFWWFYIVWRSSLSQSNTPPGKSNLAKWRILVISHATWEWVVEARGIEPLSENPSIQLSPGAAYLLRFPNAHADRQACVKVAL